MAKNFTEIAYTEAVKEAQKQFSTREFNERIESIEKPEALGPGEIEFITTREDFHLASSNENGWPYVQHKGGPKGFLHVLDERTLAYADYRGNKQYISTGNINQSQKALLFLMNYPTQQRLKIWVEARIIDTNQFPELLDNVKPKDYDAVVERIVLMKVRAYDWNCTSHIQARFTLGELKQIFQENPAVKDAFFNDLDK